jgi:SprT protein
MNHSDIQQISDCINKYFEMAKTFWPFQLRDWKKPTLSFDLRGTTAGAANLRENHIKINQGLFSENKEAFFKRTIPHEVAHLVAYIVFGDTGHGVDWKFTMNRFGCDSSRCHSYDVSNVKISKTVTRFLYTCQCSKPLHLTKGQHVKLLGGNRCVCSKCRSVPVFSGKALTFKS